MIFLMIRNIEEYKNEEEKERNTLLKLRRQIFQEKEIYTEEELSKLKLKKKGLMSLKL